MDASSSDKKAGVGNENAKAFPPPPPPREMTTHHRRDPSSTAIAADSLNASCFTFRKARSKLTREKASRAVPATKSFRKIGSCEDDRAVEERKVGMRECWRKIDAKFESVLREANLEAVSSSGIRFLRSLFASFFSFFVSLSLCVCSFVFADLSSLAYDAYTYRRPDATVFEDPRLRRRDVSETPRRGGFGNGVWER